jgi:ectoine hydroxylase
MTLPISDLYESRYEPDAAIVVRREPVVHSDDAFATPAPLGAELLQEYQKNGFLLLPGLFSQKEIATLNSEVESMASEPHIRKRQECVIEPESNAVRSIFMVHKLNKVMERLASDERLVQIARQVLASEVYLHQTRVNLKPGFEGKEFYWHSDFETWHIEDGMPEMRAVSFSILLTENTVFNGPLMLISGSHQYFISCIGETPEDHFKQSLQRQQYGVPDHDSLKMLCTLGGGIRSMTGPPGTVVMFDCNTMHGSYSNISPYPRHNIFFVYNSVHNTLRDPRYGLHPRPEHIATRDAISPVKPIAWDFSEEEGFADPKIQRIRRA